MQIINYLKKNQISLIILLLSLLLILPKWVLSFTFFDENITLRIINDTSDAAYYPLINSFSDFNLSNSYDDNLNNLKLICFKLLIYLLATLCQSPLATLNQTHLSRP